MKKFTVWCILGQANTRLYMALLSEHQSFFHMTEIIMSIVIHHVILYTETNIPKWYHFMWLPIWSISTRHINRTIKRGNIMSSPIKLSKSLLTKSFIKPFVISLLAFCHLSSGKWHFCCEERKRYNFLSELIVWNLREIHQMVNSRPGYDRSGISNSSN